MPTADARTGQARLWHDGSVLRKLYEQDGKTQRQIAEELGCSVLTINKAFKKHNISCKRGRRPSSKRKKKAPTVTRGRTVAARPSLATTPIQARFIELTNMMEELGPHAREGVKQDLHDLVDRL